MTDKVVQGIHIAEEMKVFAGSKDLDSVYHLRLLFFSHLFKYVFPRPVFLIAERSHSPWSFSLGLAYAFAGEVSWLCLVFLDTLDVRDLVFARNCCIARMLPGEAELVSE